MSHMRPKGLEQHQSIKLFLRSRCSFLIVLFTRPSNVFCLFVVTCDCCVFFSFHFPRFCPPTTTRWVVTIPVTRFVYSFRVPSYHIISTDLHVSPAHRSRIGLLQPPRCHFFPRRTIRQHCIEHDTPR
ncbi:hypothetical protein BDV38DRAFT_4483 [Aspergillus pseudotamarii]|uniref:Uncharacterized protein n=1 Tax=Aspergillus pseudotamarii TaxID=132259 RepID=A0A5N6TC88_ASPPS|nr:uncharacterized protein BDV38DRAFT_4483 [Aspergillus pseudotamarii]KAE8143912.1 hypothetical protein BDV38DRAFT_4483 [Aspergillus pseudotamarii]